MQEPKGQNICRSRESPKGATQNEVSDSTVSRIEDRGGPDRTDLHRFWSRRGTCCAAWSCRGASDQDYEKRGSVSGTNRHTGDARVLHRQGHARSAEARILCLPPARPPFATLHMIRNTAGPLIWPSSRRVGLPVEAYRSHLFSSQALLARHARLAGPRSCTREHSECSTECTMCRTLLLKLSKRGALHGPRDNNNATEARSTSDKRPGSCTNKPAFAWLSSSPPAAGSKCGSGDGAVDVSCQNFLHVTTSVCHLLSGRLLRSHNWRAGVWSRRRGPA